MLELPDSLHIFIMYEQAGMARVCSFWFILFESRPVLNQNLPPDHIYRIFLTL